MHLAEEAGGDGEGDGRVDEDGQVRAMVQAAALVRGRGGRASRPWGAAPRGPPAPSRRRADQPSCPRPTPTGARGPRGALPGAARRTGPRSRRRGPGGSARGPGTRAGGARPPWARGAGVAADSAARRVRSRRGRGRRAARLPGSSPRPRPAPRVRGAFPWQPGAVAGGELRAGITPQGCEQGAPGSQLRAELPGGGRGVVLKETISSESFCFLFFLT